MTDQELQRVEKIASAAEFMFKEMWSAMWPRGCCVTTSLILAPILRAAIPIKFYIMLNKGHMWIESSDGDIIDPTYGQFDKSRNESLLVLKADAEKPDRLIATHKLTKSKESKYRRRLISRGDNNGFFPLAVGVKEDYWRA